MRTRSKLVVFVLMVMLFLIVSGNIFAQPIPLPSASGQPRASIGVITNGGFDIDANSDKLPDGWTGNNTGAATADKMKCDTETKTVSLSAPCAFFFRGNADGSTSALQQVITDTSALTNATDAFFIVNVNAKNVASGQKIALAKFIYDDGTSAKITLNAPESLPSGYYDLGAGVELDPAKTIVKIKVKILSGGATSKYYADDASLSVTAPALEAYINTCVDNQDGTYDATFGIGEVPTGTTELRFYKEGIVLIGSPVAYNGELEVTLSAVAAADLPVVLVVAYNDQFQTLGSDNILGNQYPCAGLPFDAEITACTDNGDGTTTATFSISGIPDYTDTLWAYVETSDPVFHDYLGQTSMDFTFTTGDLPIYEVAARDFQDVLLAPDFDLGDLSPCAVPPVQ